MAFHNLSRPKAGINDKLQIFSLTAAVLASSADNTVPGRVLPWDCLPLSGAGLFHGGPRLGLWAVYLSGLPRVQLFMFVGVVS